MKSFIAQVGSRIKAFGFYRFLFAIWAGQGVLALFWLLSIPAEGGAFSTSRLVLLGGLLGCTLGSTLLTVRSRNDWPELSAYPRLHNVLYLIALLMVVLPPAGLAVLYALGQTVSNVYVAYFERLAPLACWGMLAGLEWCLLRSSLRSRTQPTRFPALFPYILLVFIGLALLMGYTGWGITPLPDGSFGSPPTPLLEWQIALALCLGAVALLTQARWRSPRADVWVGVAIFVLTVVVWLSDPLIPASFATPPRAPNYEVYPYSDAYIYAQYAQSALVGEGFIWPDVPTRPLYVAFLTWLHALAGQEYGKVIALQTVILALFPVALYWLGRELGSRPLGVMLAVLAVLRDVTTNHVAPLAGNISYTKLYFSEMPTALLLVIFTIGVLRWMKTPRPTDFLLRLGGVLGAAVLIRLQSLILLAPLALFTGLVMWKARRMEWLRGMLIVTVSVVVVMVPWLVRNHLATGGLVLDNPISQSMTLARRWSGDTGNTILPRLPNETTAQYTSRMTAIALESLKDDPQRILGAATSHFFNSLVASLQILPARDRLNSPADLFWPQHVFWQTGHLPVGMLIASAVLLALGLAAAWQWQGWVGWLPFGLGLGYNAWTALFLSSGDRFLLPIDWTWYLYDCIGLLVLLQWALTGWRQTDASLPSPQLASSPKPNLPSRPRIFQSLVLVLVIGLSLPLTEWVFPQKYPARTVDQLASGLGLQLQADEMIVYGRAIYPRYYEAGDGEPGSAKLGYGASPEARLVFWLAGPTPSLVILPLGAAPEFIPHTADVWVVGHQADGVLYASWVKVVQNDRSAIYNAYQK